MEFVYEQKFRTSGRLVSRVEALRRQRIAGRAGQDQLGKEFVVIRKYPLLCLFEYFSFF